MKAPVAVYNLFSIISLICLNSLENIWVKGSASINVLLYVQRYYIKRVWESKSIYLSG